MDRQTPSLSIYGAICMRCAVKAKFHYASRSLTLTSSQPNSITLSSLRLTREQVCDQLASWTKTHVCTSCACRRPNSITLSSLLAGRRSVHNQISLRCDLLASSRAGRRPASKQGSVMEYGLNRSATRFKLSRHVEIARTCLRQVGSQVCDEVCDLDSVMEFGLNKQIRYTQHAALICFPPTAVVVQQHQKDTFVVLSKNNANRIT